MGDITKDKLLYIMRDHQSAIEASSSENRTRGQHYFKVGESTVLCVICSQDRVRVQAACSDDDDSSSSDDDNGGDGQFTC